MSSSGSTSEPPSTPKPTRSASAEPAVSTPAKANPFTCSSTSSPPVGFKSRPSLLIEPTKGHPLLIYTPSPRSRLASNAENGGKYIFQYFPADRAYELKGYVPITTSEFKVVRSRNLLADLSVRILEGWTSIYGGVMKGYDQQVAELKEKIVVERGEFIKGIGEDDLALLEVVADIICRFQNKSEKGYFGEEYFGKNAVELVMLMMDKDVVHVTRKLGDVLTAFWPFGLKKLRKQEWVEKGVGKPKSESEVWDDLLKWGDYKDVIVYYIEDRKDTKNDAKKDGKGGGKKGDGDQTTVGFSDALAVEKPADAESSPGSSSRPPSIDESIANINKSQKNIKVILDNLRSTRGARDPTTEEENDEEEDVVRLAVIMGTPRKEGNKKL